MTWSLTVAAIIERQGRFLVVEETDGVHPEHVLNQPAGHVDPGESILDAVKREVLEETGLPFEPTHLVGIYQIQAKNGRDYVRICFGGRVPPDGEARPQDPIVLACHWRTREEIAAFGPRSSAVLACIEDYLAGVKLPLSAVSGFLKDRQG